MSWNTTLILFLVIGIGILLYVTSISRGGTTSGDITPMPLDDETPSGDEITPMPLDDETPSGEEITPLPSREETLKSGTWSYGEWTQCSELCGGGTQSRTKTCTGGICDASQAEPISRACNTQACPKNEGWGTPIYSKCSLPCGGTMTETVSCQGADGYNGTCFDEKGIATKTTKTNTVPCNSAGMCPKNSGWNDPVISACSKPCGGGIATKTVTCKGLPEYDGYCFDANGMPTKETQTDRNFPCKTEACPKNAGWSPTPEIPTCSTMCGGGGGTQTTACLGAAGYDGYCFDENGLPTKNAKIIYNAPCNTQACPRNEGWGIPSYSTCSEYCGGEGTQTKTIPCGGLPNYLGYCFDENGLATKQTQTIQGVPCNTQSCPTNGGWGTPTYSTCSEYCGGGTLTETLPCVGLSDYGGNCYDENGIPSKTTKTIPGVACNTQSCPKYSASVPAGWVTSTYGQCSKPCGGGTQTNVRKCAGMKEYGGKCFDENGNKVEPGAVKTDTGVTCNTRTCPVSGGFDAGTYTPCSTPCGPGTQQFVRKCIGMPEYDGYCFVNGVYTKDNDIIPMMGCMYPKMNQPCSVINGGWSDQYTQVITGWYDSRYICKTCTNPVPSGGGADCTPTTDPLMMINYRAICQRQP